MLSQRTWSGLGNEAGGCPGLLHCKDVWSTGSAAVTTFRRRLMSGSAVGHLGGLWPSASTQEEPEYREGALEVGGPGLPQPVSLTEGDTQ